MQITVGDVDAALSADGTNLGYIKVTDNTPFYPGAKANLYSGGGVPSVLVLITDVGVDGNSIGCRIIPVSPLTGSSLGTGPNYGRSDVSAFTTANSAHINMFRQAVEVNPANAKLSLL